MSQSKGGLSNLFAGAVSTGVVGAQSASLLTGHLGDVVVAGAAGKDLEDIEAADVTLVTVLLDASSSIHDRGLEEAVREGYNGLLDSFAMSRERESILLALWVFNHERDVLHSYVPVAEAATLDAKRYRVGGATHLYDTWCDALAANIAYAQRLRDGGTPCRSIVVVVTDGEDYGSKRTPAECAVIAKDLLASEQFVLAFVGVGSDVDFRAVARSMGVPDGNILVQANATAGALRQAFEMVSRSAIRVSQSMLGPGSGGGFFN